MRFELEWGGSWDRASAERSAIAACQRRTRKGRDGRGRSRLRCHRHLFADFYENERSNHAEQPRKRCVDDGSRKEFDQVLEECELVTHRHRHGDCPRGSGGGVSYDNGAKSNTQGRA